MSDSKTEPTAILTPFLEEEAQRDDPARSTLSPFTDETAFAEPPDAELRDMEREEDGFDDMENPELEKNEAFDGSSWLESEDDSGEDDVADEDIDALHEFDDPADDEADETFETYDDENYVDEEYEEEDFDEDDEPAEAEEAAYESEDDLGDDFDEELDPGEDDDNVSADEESEPVFELESGSSLAEKVRWYQSILKYAHGFDDVPVNGKHNDTATRNAMRELQKRWKLKTVNGYLTVEGNLALTKSALDWIYYAEPSPLDRPVTKGLRDAVKRFQRSYDLDVDGKVGVQTRLQMGRVLSGKDPMPNRNFHPYLPFITRELIENEAIGDGDEEHEIDAGIIGSDDREIVRETAGKPYRWICQLENRWGVDTQGFTNGTGILISPRHVLTCAHVASNWIDTVGGDRVYRDATSIKAIPARNGIAVSQRFFKVAPFGSYDVDLEGSFIPNQWRRNKHHYIRHDWDFAVLKLTTPLGLSKITPEKLFFRKGNHPLHKELNFGFWSGPLYRICVATNDAPSHSTRASAENAAKWRKLVEATLHTGGYPGTHRRMQIKASGKAASLYQLVSETMKIPGNRSKVRQIGHFVDCTPGQSGSILWKRDRIEINGRGRRRLNAVGICTRGNGNTRETNTMNYGVAITPDVVRAICNYDKDTFYPRRDGKDRIIGLGVKKNAR